MTELHKKKKRTAYSFYKGLIKLFFTLAVIVVIGAILCVSFVEYSIEKQNRQTIAEFQPIIREQCNLPDYQATPSYLGWDPMPSYYDYLEEQNLQIDCYSFGTWHCQCYKQD